MRLLLIENSKTLASLILCELQKVVELEIDWAETQEDAIQLIDRNGASNYGIAVSCLNLPDSPNGEVIQAITEYQIPTIIFTARFDEKLREEFIETPGVVDYVVKESHSSLRYLCNMVYRLVSNRKIKALVVDDSRSIRMYVCEMLRQYQFQVLEASNGQEGLDILEKNRDIQLVVTDYNMDGIDGFELTKQIRETYDKEELAIIGLSGTSSPTLSARFIKMGANDFLTKPFQPEEFYCRVTQNIDLIEKTKKLLDAATKDFLTGLYNRRFFFEKGTKKLQRMRVDGISSYVVMLDIDHFKSVNDTFGHDVGDEVLKAISNLLAENVRDFDLVARLGGEEFCIILENVNKEQAAVILENIRLMIEHTEFKSLKERRNVTTSFGAVPIGKDDDLDSVVKRADELLYDAKQTGRNRVTIE